MSLLSNMLMRNRRPAVETPFAHGLCLTCVRAKFSKWSQLKVYLDDFMRRVLVEKQEPEPLDRCLLCLDEDHPSDHLCVRVEGRYLVGGRCEAAVDQALADLAGCRPGPTPRFGMRRALNPAIVEQLNAMGFQKLMHIKNRTSTLTLRLQGKRDGASTELPAPLLFRVAERDFDINWSGTKQTYLIVESGMPVFNSLLEVQGEQQQFRVDDHLGGTKPNELLNLHAWALMDFYLVLAGERDIIQQIDARWQANVPPIGHALRQLGLDHNRHACLVGDLAIIQMYLLGRTAFFPGVGSMEALFERLETLGYPRTTGTKDTNVYQRREMVFKEMSAAMEAVRLVQVDWAPLRASLVFPHSS